MPSFATCAIAGIAVVVSLIPAPGLGQSSPASGPARRPSTAPPAQAPADQAPANRSDADAAFLAKANSLYYSTTKLGLTGFDCTVRPDWVNIFKTVLKGSPSAADEKPIAVLNSAKITIHARLTGPGSGLEWTPGPTALPDQESFELLEYMHQSTGQALQTFMQFWTPFVNGSVIPDPAAGSEVKKTETGHTIHTMDGSASITEVLDAGNVVKQFNVETQGAKIVFEPSYKPTPNGLLVSGFAARIQPPGAAPDKEQKMNVVVEYQTVNGFLIPHTLSMDVAGTGNFTFTLDGCTVNPAAQSSAQ
jgi:hypothetical protein